MPNLKLFQIPWTGYDFCTPADMPSGVPVCNTFEHESAIAEYVLLAMLEWQIGLRRMDAGFLAELIADHRLDEDEAMELAVDLAYTLAKRAYRL